jgi:hypothetical protein
MDPPPLPHHPTILTLTPHHLHLSPIRQSSLSPSPPIIPFHNRISPPPLHHPSASPFHHPSPHQSYQLTCSSHHLSALPFPYSLHLFLLPFPPSPRFGKVCAERRAAAVQWTRGYELAATELSSHSEVPASGLVSSSLCSLHAAPHDVPLPCQQRCQPFPPPLPILPTSHPPSIMVPPHPVTATPASYLRTLSQASSSVVSSPRHYSDLFTVSRPLSLSTHHICPQLNSPEVDGFERSSSAVAPCLLSEVCSPGRILSVLAWKHKPSRQRCRLSRSSRLPSLSYTQPLSTRAALFTSYTRNTAVSPAAATRTSARHSHPQTMQTADQHKSHICMFV